NHERENREHIGDSIRGGGGGADLTSPSAVHILARLRALVRAFGSMERTFDIDLRRASSTLLCFKHSANTKTNSSISCALSRSIASPATARWLHRSRRSGYGFCKNLLLTARLIILSSRYASLGCSTPQLCHVRSTPWWIGTNHCVRRSERLMGNPFNG